MIIVNCTVVRPFVDRPIECCVTTSSTTNAGLETLRHLQRCNLLKNTSVLFNSVWATDHTSKAFGTQAEFVGFSLVASPNAGHKLPQTQTLNDAEYH